MQKIYAGFRQGVYPSDAEFLACPDTAAKTVDAGMQHIDHICTHIDVARIRKANIRIAVDSINGAAGAIFPRLLDRLGCAWVG